MPIPAFARASVGGINKQCADLCIWALLQLVELLNGATQYPFSIRPANDFVHLDWTRPKAQFLGGHIQPMTQYQDGGYVGKHVLRYGKRILEGNVPRRCGRDHKSNRVRTKFSCPHGVCDRGLLASVYQDIMTAPDRIAAMKTAWATHITYECKDVLGEQTPRGAACRERFVTFEANKAVWLAGYVAPAVEVWTVKINGTQLTRPVQKISESNGLTTTTERVNVGAPCYPLVRKFTNAAANTYAAIDPLRPDRVAVCARG